MTYLAWCARAVAAAQRRAFGFELRVGDHVDGAQPITLTVNLHGPRVTVFQWDAPPPPSIWPHEHRCATQVQSGNAAAP